jgi:hypothetical protein
MDVPGGDAFPYLNPNLNHWDVIFHDTFQEGAFGVHGTGRLFLLPG